MGESITNWVNAVGEKWLMLGGFFIGILSGGIILLITVKSIGKKGLDDPFARWEEEDENEPEDIEDKEEEKRERSNK